MALMLPVKDGKVVYGTDQTNKTDKESNYKTREVDNTMDKDAFLQLLVAQMKYQDPLEPTDNTEYVAQLATFSELEAMTNLNDAMSISRASELVGKKVTIQTVSATTGDVTEAVGNVDYVMIENNKAFLVIDGKPYSIDDLTGVMTEDYWKKYQDSLEQESQNATTIMAAIATLPADVEEITLEHADFVKAIRKAYDELPDEEKRQVAGDYLYHLIQAEARIAKLQAEDSKNEGTEGSGDASGDKDDEQGDEAGTTA